MGNEAEPGSSPDGKQNVLLDFRRPKVEGRSVWIKTRQQLAYLLLFISAASDIENIMSMRNLSLYNGNSVKFIISDKVATKIC